DGRLVGAVDIDLSDEIGQLDEWSPWSRWLRPLVRFMAVESSSGFVLLACAVAALVLANSPWAVVVADFWHTSVGLQWGDIGLTKPLHFWINDGLMTLFFF